MDVGRDYRTVRQVYQTHGKTAREDSSVLSVEMRCARRPAFEKLFFILSSVLRKETMIGFPFQ